AVVDDEVQVDVVGGAKAAACQRAGDGNAPDERPDRDQLADEGQGELDVRARLGLVGPRPASDLGGSVARGEVDHEVFGDGKFWAGRDGPTDLILRHRAPKAKLGQAGNRQGVATPSKQGDRPADSIQQSGRVRDRVLVLDSHLVGYGQGLRQHPVWRIIEPGAATNKRRVQMTADGHFQVPQPTTDPVRSYSPRRPPPQRLKSRLADLTDARTELQLQIGGDTRRGPSRGDIRAPQRT